MREAIDWVVNYPVLAAEKIAVLESRVQELKGDLARQVEIANQYMRDSELLDGLESIQGRLGYKQGRWRVSWFSNGRLLQTEWFKTQREAIDAAMQKEATVEEQQ